MEAKCTWPDGTVREVFVVDDDGVTATINWNERVDCKDKAVTGFDSEVPSAWLTYPTICEQQMPDGSWAPAEPLPMYPTRAERRIAWALAVAIIFGFVAAYYLFR